MKKTVCLVLAVVLILFAGTVPVYAADRNVRGGDAHRSGGIHRGGDAHRGGGIHRGRDIHRGGDVHRRWGGHRGWDGYYGGVWIGPGWGPWWWGPPYYPYYPQSSVVIQQDYPAHVEPALQPEEQTYYWYYCEDSRAYYPYVKQCPGGWLKVVPPQTVPDERE